MNYEGSDLLKLAELLKPPDDAPKADCSKAIQANSHNQNVQVKKTETPKTLEEFEMQQELEFNELTMESKKQPQFNIKYSQAVTAEDVFLQLGPKTPSSSSCEDMIITIELPDEKFSAMDLNLTKTDLKLDGFIYKLRLSLPHPINPDLSNAKWNQTDETLVLTLRMCREFDFVNF
ncbi:dynein axonemal assembly factor 6 [Arctopsyche grandis]|uniref:dynein axonemal assembly factor 6 n=1 Tax=Arctopsyche grandis TaxID=121162 RepID=UPI00406D8ECB